MPDSQQQTIIEGAPRDFAEGEERELPGAPRDFAEGQEHPSS